MKLGDFVARIGSVLVGTIIRGVLLELDFMPCDSAQSALPIIDEMFEILIGRKNWTVPVDAWSLSDPSTRANLADVAYQFVSLFRHEGLL